MPENPHFTTKVASQVQALDGLLLSSEANVALRGQKGGALPRRPVHRLAHL